MTRALNPKAQWLLEQLARDDLSQADRKRYANRLKVTAKRPVTHNSGFYTVQQYDRIKRGRKLKKTHKRRNRG